MALGFRDSEALRVVVTSGLCPPAIAETAARIARAGDGSIVLDPAQALPRAVLQQLRAAGVTVDAKLPRDHAVIGCWAEAIALARVAVAAVPSQLMFLVDPAALTELAAELVRLGCDRQELFVGDRIAAIRALDPPTYTAMRALDREAGLCAFALEPDAQDAIWTELGYRHPLASQLRAPPGALVLIGRDGWLAMPDRGWLPVDAALELRVAGSPITHRPNAPLPARRAVELRLARGRRAAASLWVIRRAAMAAIDQLLSYLPDDVVAKLSFAVTGGDEPIAIVRARSGRHAPPELALAGEPYAPLVDLPDVYAPAGSTVEPPLRRDRLRTVLGATGNDVIWLAATGGEAREDGPFRVERIADSAFMPLAEWAEYVLHASAPAFAPWQRATELEFAAFVSTGLEWGSQPSNVPRGYDDDRDAAKAPRVKQVRAAAPAPAPIPAESLANPSSPAPQAAATPPPDAAAAADAVHDRELATLEAAFVALDAPADADERVGLLERLAIAYATLGRRRDAGLCIARAVWGAPPAGATHHLDAWLHVDRRITGASALDDLLGQASPELTDVRAVAALAARTPEDPNAPAHRQPQAPRGVVAAWLELVRDPHRVQRWLDEHDGSLDARMLWLSRLGLARLAGGDPLALARTRDRILSRLAGGLSAEHDLPAFLQLAGRSGALGNASSEHLQRALDDLGRRIATTRRKRSVNEAPAQYTGAYVEFQLAHGYARIARHERARELLVRARTALAQVASDPVHACLSAAFEVRVEQAIAGAPPETPLPESVAVQLGSLDRLARFKVDRLREASRILEPVVRLDAFGGYIQGDGDARGPEFAALRGLDARARATSVGALIDAARARPPDRERLLDGVLDVLLELGEADAVPMLARTHGLIVELPEPRRAVLYAKALVVAGHFGATELVPPLLELVGSAIRGVAPADLERVLHQSLRALRRIGLRHEIAELLARAEHALPPSGPDALRGRLALAGGLAYLGQPQRAMPAFELAHTALGGTLLLAARLDLTRALALAYAQVPLATALAGIDRIAAQLRDITDSLATNSHYCLSVLHFVESLVLGITSDDLALGEAGRRFIEDDEHLIRRRLHRDLGGVRDR